MLVTGRRFGGPEAVGRGIAGEALAEEEVLPRAVAIARELAGKDRATMAALKRGLHRRALDILLQR
jgi:enoyl-CoA hydratase/carnithine racemase